MLNTIISALGLTSVVGNVLTAVVPGLSTVLLGVGSAVYGLGLGLGSILGNLLGASL